MDKNKIIELLTIKELTDIEELTYKDEVFVLRFYYDFDESELKAARAYANDESEEIEDSEAWAEEFFLPYLTDLAIDNVGEYIEEVMEDVEVSAQYMSYDLNADEVEYCEFIAIFHKEDKDIEIETVLDDLKL
ncbi:MAG: hypothetical protein H7Y18_16165 [Clostridiaceae bacterium]|nr:hypothetical protein [Clostridiaceae bacterium]